MLHEGFCSLAQRCHCCDMGRRCCYAWGAACLVVPAWRLLQGCSAAGLALTSRQRFQAFSCVAAVPSAGNVAFCHDFLPGFDSLCLPNTGAEQGLPCGRCCGPRGCLVRSVKQHVLARDPQNKLPSSLPKLSFSVCNICS